MLDLSEIMNRNWALEEALDAYFPSYKKKIEEINKQLEGIDNNYTVGSICHSIAPTAINRITQEYQKKLIHILEQERGFAYGYLAPYIVVSNSKEVFCC